MLIIYGIPNCDTVKKARRWLADHDIEYQFHDFKKAGLDASKLDEWLSKVDWEILLNRRGMMWRKAPDDVRANIDETSAKQLMMETPTIIKRPVMELNGAVHVGFSEENYSKLLG